MCTYIYIYIVCPDFNQQGFTGQPERTCCDWFGDVALISRTPWVFPGRAKITDLDRQKLVESQIVGFHLKQVFQKTPNWLASLKVFNLILYLKKKNETKTNQTENLESFPADWCTQAWEEDGWIILTRIPALVWMPFWQKQACRDCEMTQRNKKKPYCPSSEASSAAEQTNYPHLKGPKEEMEPLTWLQTGKHTRRKLSWSIAEWISNPAH